jgi:hypothetical protein
MRRHSAVASVAALIVLAGSLGACASYMTPGKPADFHALGITGEEAANVTENGIAKKLARRPAAGFPASIAAVRVQGPNYSSYSTGEAYGSGNFTIVTNRDVETDEQFERLTKMPLVRGIAPMNRIVVPANVSTEKDLREAAANLQADMVLIYTFDTKFGSETVVPALGTITLGIFPAEQARVTSTASAALVDTRTGYIYGLVEGTAKTSQMANAWTSTEACDQARRRAEGEAFGKLVDNIDTMWRGVATAYGPASTGVGAKEGAKGVEK